MTLQPFTRWHPKTWFPSPPPLADDVILQQRVEGLLGQVGQVLRSARLDPHRQRHRQCRERGRGEHAQLESDAIIAAARRERLGEQRSVASWLSAIRARNAGVVRISRVRTNRTSRCST